MVISPQNYSSKSASCGAAHWDTQWLLFSPWKEQQSLQDGRCHLIAVVSPQTPRHTNSFRNGLWKVLKGSSTASTFYDILKGSFQWIRPTNITTKKTIFKYTSLWGLKSSKLWAVFLSSHKVALTNQIERGILSFFKGHLAVSKNQTHLNLKKRKSPLVTLSC